MNIFNRGCNKFSIQIKPDADGFTGRECPVEECEGYFKIQFGTGLEGDVPCHCPYCGHTASHDQFFTKEQIEYAKSVALHKITVEFLKGRPIAIRYYREKKLETEVICNRCTLRYAIYGVFGYCPDCGTHNSLQILNTNLDIVGKMLSLSKEPDKKDFAAKLVENALEDAVSSMDGFGREVCKAYAPKSSDAAKAQNISLQNIAKARDQIRSLFNIDITTPLAQDEWASLTRAFQKRHLVAHRMGVIDQQYIDTTGERPSLIGRKVEIKPEEVSELAKGLRKIGSYLSVQLERLNQHPRAD